MRSGIDGPAAGSGACRLDGMPPHTPVPYPADRAHWTRARRRPAGFGGRTPGPHTGALGKTMRRREEIDSWIADIGQDGSGNHATGGLA